MANALYDKGREKFLLGEIDWVDDDIKGILVDLADYTPNLGTHDVLDDIPAGAIVATSANLTGKSATNGVADADNVTFESVSGDSVEALILYKDTGSAETSPLIAFFDTGVGMPFTPSGSDYIVVWDDGANRIFKL